MIKHTQHIYIYIEKKNTILLPAGVSMCLPAKTDLSEGNEAATDIKVSAWLSIIVLPPQSACL